MPDLAALGETVAQSFRGRSQTQARAALSLKVAIALLSGAAAAVQILAGAQSGVWTASIYVGVFTAAAAAAIAAYFAWIDKDGSTELETARVAIALANEAKDEANELVRSLTEYQQEFKRYETEQIRASELYRAVNLMRETMENILQSEQIDLVRSIQVLMEAGKRSLTIALGFQMAEHHTLGVYIAEFDDSIKKKVLRCIAHSRTIDCSIADARKWPTGVGVAGAAYARGFEVIVPDMSAVTSGNIWVPTKPEDPDRYRSIAAVPVSVGTGKDPWGVVVGTSDRVQHFSIEPEASGVQTVEAIRALAGMVALAVKADEMRRKHQRATVQNQASDTGKNAASGNG